MISRIFTKKLKLNCFRGRHKDKQCRFRMAQAYEENIRVKSQQNWHKEN